MQRRTFNPNGLVVFCLIAAAISWFRDHRLWATILFVLLGVLIYAGWRIYKARAAK
jgi:predicted negative regulator of RcsB-dependent stress response